ncbi:MAG: DUF2784 domain-containing protein [Methylophilaceae bacterium]
MVFKVLADLVVLIHFLFIAFAVLGGALALRWRWMPWVHLPVAAWGAAIEFMGWFCPLTPLENSLRRASGELGYAQGFIERYLIPIIYPGDLTRELQIVLGCVVVGVNLALYCLVWRQARHPKAGL